MNSHLETAVRHECLPIKNKRNSHLEGDKNTQ